MLAGIVGHDVKGDASLHSFPVTLGFSMLRKPCLLSRGILPVCIAFGDGGCMPAASMANWCVMCALVQVLQINLSSSST